MSKLVRASLTGATAIALALSFGVIASRPAALIAPTSVVWSLELTAFWMIFLVGYIAAPPKIAERYRAEPAQARK
jgi:hypothetical protein